MPLSSVCFGLLLVFFCQEPKQPTIIDTYCQKTEFQFWHQKDTRKTKEQIDRHNARREASKCPR